MIVWLLLGCPLLGSDYRDGITDRDGDGFDGVAFEGVDCDDDDPSVHPGAPEAWYDGVDQDCDGGDDFDQDRDGVPQRDDCDDTDPRAGAASLEAWFDGDRDGYGAGAPTLRCSFDEDWVDDGDDCDDGDGEVFPGAPETWYDGIDQDCDRGPDDDQDRDGLALAQDCDDTDPAIGEPDATQHLDTDGDGFAGPLTETVCPDEVVAGAHTDCDDTRADVFPGAAETWHDGVDQDCAGDDDFDADQDRIPFPVDCDDFDPSTAGPALWFPDGDGDGHGRDDGGLLGCEPPPGTIALAGDCDDGDDTINPSAAERCDADDVDEDCDGLADDLDPSATGKTPYYPDADGDGFGVGSSELRCDTDGRPLAPEAGDCDDDDADAHPGAIWFADRDQDGYGDPTDALGSCERIAQRAPSGDDCDDDDPTIHPGADDPRFTWRDEDCARDSDVDQDGDGLPDPYLEWYGQAACPRVGEHIHVPGDAPTIQDGIDRAQTCDTVIVAEGTWAPFVVDRPFIVVTAAPGARVRLTSVGQSIRPAVGVYAPGVVIAGMEIEDVGFGLEATAPTYAEWMTVRNAEIGISSAADLTLFGLDLSESSIPLTVSAGDLILAEADLSDNLSAFGVISVTSGEAPPPETHGVVLNRVDLRGCAAAFGPLVGIDADEVFLQDLTVADSSGAILDVRTQNVVGHRLEIGENVVVGAYAMQFRARSSSVVGEAALHDVTVAQNIWAPLFATGFLVVDDYTTTFLDRVSFRGNLLVDVLGEQPVWIRSLTDYGLLTGFLDVVRILQHIDVSATNELGPGQPTGIGIHTHGGIVEQYTAVGLDAAIWSHRGHVPGTPAFQSDPPIVANAILWGNQQLAMVDDYLWWTGAPPTPEDVVSDISMNCAGCLTDDPEFLRYHPDLPSELWDLRLRRESPYYRWQDPSPDTGPTCDDALVVGTVPLPSYATEAQIGAFGNRAQLNPGVDPLAYNDCDEDGLYDTWESEFLTPDPAADPDGDGVTNLQEFQLGTFPTAVDTDGDGFSDHPSQDARPLDPLVH